MAAPNVLKLDDHRGRRRDRTALARALARPDPARGVVVDCLLDIARASGADRVAAVWVDEFGPGLVHPFAVVDLRSDHPRRAFSAEPLRQAWELGVPAARDIPPGGTERAATLAIALGSSGTRAWFLVADSVTPRPLLDHATRDKLMFVAGECSAIVLHRDLDTGLGDGASSERFAGWPVLQDLEGRDDDDAAAGRIRQRFVLARLVDLVLDEDLVPLAERLADQVASARRELGREPGLGPAESAAWTEVLDGLEAERWVDVAATLLELGRDAEGRGDDHCAAELYRCGYGYAAALHAPEPAAQAARFLGRLYRRRAERALAAVWYQSAREIAEVTGSDRIAALARVGAAIVTQERGRIAEARAELEAALPIAERSGDAEALVTTYRALAMAEQSAGDFELAVDHNWRAVRASASDRDRLHALAGLAGASAEVGDLDLAEDAWHTVAAQTDEVYLQVFAYDALAYLRALRGDEGGFRSFAARCDAIDRSHLHSAHAQILHYRGLSYGALGLLDDAARCLEEAIDFSSRHGFSETVIRAEQDLGRLDSLAKVRPAEPVASPEVREGVRAMRRELVGSLA